MKTPKLHFLDSGLLATLLGATAVRIAKDRSIFGALLETFLFSDIEKQVSWMEESCSLYNYRDKDQDEVDIVVEYGSGGLVGIEVKASATVNTADFKGAFRRWQTSVAMTSNWGWCCTTARGPFLSATV